MAFFSSLKRIARAALNPTAASTSAALDALLQLELSRELARLQDETRLQTPGNPAAHGFKVYSQADEDGIVERICDQLSLATGSVAEIGCGDGRENNSHYLLLKGWRGIWIDGDASNIRAIRKAVPVSSRLHVIKAIVTRNNVAELIRSKLSALGGPLDVLSVDVDGNDLPIAQTAINALSPALVVGEYNAKFRFPMIAAIAYESQHRWRHDDYHGASLAAWVHGLAPAYQLVCCNLAGTNAFFVRGDLADRFPAHAPERLYQPARFHLTALRSGHAPSLSFLKDALARDTQSGLESTPHETG